MGDQKKLTTEEKLDKVVMDVDEIKIALKGYNGFRGLCDSHNDLSKDYYNFKRCALILFGIAVGTGILSTGLAVGIPELLGK